MKRTDKYTFFWGGIYSNWYKRDFTVKNVKFSSGEQYMMYSKSMLFGDINTAQKIMKTHNPRRQKELGRTVSGYDDAVWQARSPGIMAAGLFHKFIQHNDLTEEILSTRGTRLVEASPEDKIWGVGLGENDPLILDEANWRGENRLGRTLDVVRDRVEAYLLERDDSPSMG